MLFEICYLFVSYINMNILALDYGKKRIGMAWIDTDLGVVLPYGVIENKEPIASRQELVDFIDKENVQKLIVGLPIGLDGKENENTKSVRKFIEEVKKMVGIPVEFIDERFSSREADRMGGEASRDEKAAMLILQTYLEQN